MVSERMFEAFCTALSNCLTSCEHGWIAVVACARIHHSAIYLYVYKIHLVFVDVFKFSAEHMPFLSKLTVRLCQLPSHNAMCIIYESF